MKTNYQKSKRVEILDEIRGFAIICMVVYHMLFDLYDVYNVNNPFINFFFDDKYKFYIVRDIFAGLFIFISGVMCRYSRNNLKRGVLCFFLGMCITFVTAVIQPQYAVLFGILHFLGISMMILGLMSKPDSQGDNNFIDIISPIIGLCICIFLFIVTREVASLSYIGFNKNFGFSVSQSLYDARLLFPFGFPHISFYSGDYFPLLPWFFVFLGGAYFGVLVKGNDLPTSFYEPAKTPVTKFLAFCGKYTIWIYIAHQPILLAIFHIVFGK